MATVASIKQIKLQNTEKNRKIIEKVKTASSNLYTLLPWEKNETSPNMKLLKWFDSISVQRTNAEWKRRYWRRTRIR